MDTYRRAHVTIDDHFARFGSKSYAIDKITSVDVRMHERRAVAWIFLALFGGIALLAGMSVLIEDGDYRGIILGVALLIPAGLMYRNRLTRIYVLMLATGAGEVQATISTDEQALKELREAIESRIARSRR